MVKKEIDEIVETYENKAGKFLDKTKEELNSRIKELKDGSEAKKKEVESAMKEYDDEFQ